MTLSTTLRQIAMDLRAELTQLEDGPAKALRAQARRLDEAVRQAERMEHVNATCLRAVPMHPLATTIGELLG